MHIYRIREPNDDLRHKEIWYIVLNIEIKSSNNTAVFTFALIVLVIISLFPVTAAKAMELWAV